MLRHQKHGQTLRLSVLTAFFAGLYTGLALGFASAVGVLMRLGRLVL